MDDENRHLRHAVTELTATVRDLRAQLAGHGCGCVHWHCQPAPYYYQPTGITWYGAAGTSSTYTVSGGVPDAGACS
jgi:hypothetical protein